MRSSLGRFHRPFARVREEQLLLLNDLGDGSTLSLDFTTMGSTLDPRLTFTRTTNATFINSSGLVEWAAANMFRNTVWGSTSLPTGWLANASNTGTVTYNGNGTITCAATSQIAWIYPDFPYVVTQTGLSYICSFRVVSISGPTLITDILSTGNFTASDYFINGVSVGASPSAPSGNVTGPCVVSVRVNATSTSWFPRLGVGVQGLIRTATITMSEPHSHPGTVPVPYLANTSTSASNHNTPRFDHDPTTLAPRGLLIEGSADNQVRNSNDIYNASFWGSSVGVSATQDTTIPDPSGGTTTCKIVKSAGVQYVVRNQPLPTLTVPANSTVNLTASVWLRMDGAGQVSPHLGIYDAAGASFGTRSGATVSNSAVTIDSGSAAIAAYTFGSVTGWVRCSVSRSFTNATGSPVTFTQLSIYIYPNQVNTNAATIYAWGAQVESGVGPSSLIPTGASTGSRAADKMSMTDISTMQWNQTAGTFALHMDVAAETNTSGFPAFMGMYTATPVRVVRFLLNNSSGTNPRIGNDTWTATPTQIVSNIGITRPTAPSAFKFAVSLSNTGQTLNQVINAGSATTTSGTGTMQTPTRFLWHQDPSASDSEYFPIHIRSLKYWPTTLPNAQLQALTT